MNHLGEEKESAESLFTSAAAAASSSLQEEPVASTSSVSIEDEVEKHTYKCTFFFIERD